LCIDVALGSILDVYTYYEGKPAAQANIYIDEDIFVGQTDSKGSLKDINVRPGSHIITAIWQDNNGNERGGASSFTAKSGSYAMRRIDLEAPRPLGWIWQLVKDING